MDKLPKKYYFIDESGDAAFYAKGKKLLIGNIGFNPLLILGLVVLDDKTKVRNKIIEFQNNVVNDPLYNTLPCINKTTKWYLHARTDQLEIRSKFIELLRTMDDFESYHVIGRKKLSTFQNKHNSNENEFYFDLVFHLLQDRLSDEKFFYHIFLSDRNGNSLSHLKNAINKAIERDNKLRTKKLNIRFECTIVQSRLTPELSIVDYLLWSLQRCILTDEIRFYKALEEKYNLIIDLYDSEHPETNYYNKENKFAKTKASEFRTDGK